MFYAENLSIIENNKIKKLGVIKGIELVGDSYNAENVELVLDAKEQKLYLTEAEEETRMVFTLNNIMIAKNVGCVAEVILLDSNNVMLIPYEGVFFVPDPENEGNYLQLDLTGKWNKKISEDTVKVIEAKTLISMIREADMETWGKYSTQHPFDYMYKFRFFSKEGLSIKCLNTEDISCGALEELARHDIMKKIAENRVKQQTISYEYSDDDYSSIYNDGRDYDDEDDDLSIYDSEEDF